MSECLAEDDLIDLATARRPLGDAPAIEAHLADCPACSGLLSTLLAAPDDGEPRADRAGDALGPYRLDARIGAGAMGEVYRGWDQRLHRHVAVKVLARALADVPDRIRRLEAEARAAAAIAHPNVVTVYDTGIDGGVAYVVTELIAGESLRSMIDRGPLARSTALELGCQLARGLAAAHAQGVVHRDLKPSNLIVTDDGTLKILDFGLAKVTGDRDVDATEPGTLLGTSGYLSPEQARGEAADARSDIFAVGAVLYEMVTGRRAFAGATFAERLSAVLRDTPAPVDDAAAPIIARCLDKDPRKRFQSAADLAWALDAVERDASGAAPAPVEVASPRARALVSRRAFVIGAAATGASGVLIGRAFAPTRARPPFVPAFQQLTFRHGRVPRARFTRDGGSLIYAGLWDDAAAALYSTRLGGGGTRALDLPAAELLAVSTRGELALSLGHRFVGGFQQRGQLALAPVEGGTPRALGLDVQDADFTPDGGELAIVRRAGPRYQLELPVGKVLLDAGWLSCPRVSPDGAAVACLVHASPYDDTGYLVVVPRTGGPPRTIGRGWSSIDGITWTADSRALWISASRAGGNNAVRAIALDGRELREMPSAGRVRVHDVSRDGHLAVTHCSGRLRMLTRPPGAPAEIDLALSDVTLLGDMSADGRAIVFEELGDVDTANGAYLRATDGAPAVRLGAGTPWDLADDGRGVLGLHRGDPFEVAVFPVSAGQPRRVELPGLAEVRWARWLPADRILVAGRRAGQRVRLWRVDPDRSQVPITDEGVAPFCAVSRTGVVALIHGERLVVIDAVAGGAQRTVPGVFADDTVCGWVADGSAVLVRTMAAPIGVRRIDVATGAATPLFVIAPPKLGLRGVFTVAVSEAGDAYAYSHSQELSRLYSMTTDDPWA